MDYRLSTIDQKALNHAICIMAMNYQPSTINLNISQDLLIFAPMSTETKEETFTLEEILTSLKTVHRLILWNDDVNTFEHVIWCMMKYLDYSETQGEKIAWEVHNKGKCAVLEGSFTEMEVYRKILQQEGLTVSVD
jgi:ATP-dependent Clp protease adaptor protein ClpS